MQSSPRIYEGLHPRDHTAAQEGVARVGGHWAMPSIALSYLFAARSLIEVGKSQRRLNALALPAAFMQRHALELAFKDVIETAEHIVRHGKWLDSLKEDSAANPPPITDDQIITHNFARLLVLLRVGLTAVGFTLPDDFEIIANRLATIDNKEATRFRYLTTLERSEEKAPSEMKRFKRLPHFEDITEIWLEDTQNELERLYETHLSFQGFDGTPSEWNLMTALFAELEAIDQRIMKIIPRDEL